MRDTFLFLIKSDFLPVRRQQLVTLQANLGYRCNPSCFHCHVDALVSAVDALSARICKALP